MAIDNKFQRVEEDDPRRCIATIASGQCPYKACDNSRYCPMHNGHRGKAQLEKKRTHSYLLGQWEGRVAQHSDADTVRSLRGEIGVLRMLLESILTNQCKDEDDLFVYAGPIGKLVDNINKVVTNCDRIETKMGMLLDRSAMIIIAGQIVEIISRHITDPVTLEEISKEIIDVITNVNGTESTD